MSDNLSAERTEKSTQASPPARLKAVLLTEQNCSNPKVFIDLAPAIAKQGAVTGKLALGYLAGAAAEAYLDVNPTREMGFKHGIEFQNVVRARQVLAKTLLEMSRAEREAIVLQAFRALIGGHQALAEASNALLKKYKPGQTLSEPDTMQYRQITAQRNQMNAVTEVFFKYGLEKTAPRVVQQFNEEQQQLAALAAAQRANTGVRGLIKKGQAFLAFKRATTPLVSGRTTAPNKKELVLAA